MGQNTNDIIKNYLNGLYSDYNDNQKLNVIESGEIQRIAGSLKQLYENIAKDGDEGSEIQNQIAAMTYINKFFWVAYGINYNYPPGLVGAIQKSNEDQAPINGPQYSLELFTNDSAEKPKNLPQMISPTTSKDESTTLYYFYKNFVEGKEILKQIVNNQKITEILKYQGVYTDPNKEKIKTNLITLVNKLSTGQPITASDLAANTDVIINNIKNSIKEVKFSNFLYCARLYYLSIRRLYNTITTDQKPASDEKPDDRKKSPESGRTTQPEVAGEQTKFRIFRHPPDEFIGAFQKKLKEFGEGHNLSKIALEDISDTEGNLQNLEDSVYGRRTHYVTRKAAVAYLEAVKRAIEKAKQSAAPKESRIRRIEILAKLLNEKLNKTKNNWLFEADEISQQEYVEKLEQLQTHLQDIVSKLEEAHAIDNWRTLPPRTAYMDKETLKKFFDLMELAEFDNDGNIINLKTVAEKANGDDDGGGSPEQPPDDKKPETPKENPQEANDQLRDASCWYTFNITIRGFGATSPKMLWSAAGLDFDAWYANINKLLSLTALPADYNYTTGLLSGYSALINLLNTRKAQNINLQCFSTLFTPFSDHLKSQIQEAVQEYKTKPEADKVKFLTSLKGYFLNEKGGYENTIAYKAYFELNQVLEVGLRKIREDLINAGTQMVNQGIPAGTVVHRIADGDTQKQIEAAASGQKNTPMTKDQALGVKADNNPVEITYTDNNKLYKLSIPPGKTGKDVITNAIEVDKEGRPITQQTSQQESLKQKREQLLHEALFKKLVK